MYPLALMLSLGLAGAADAPSAKFKAPETSAPGQPIVLDARESKSEKPLRWQIKGPASAPLVLSNPDNTVATLLSPVEGTYQVFLMATGSSPEQVDLAAQTIHVKAPEPPPPAKVEVKARLVAPDHVGSGQALILDGRTSLNAASIEWKVIGPSARDLVKFSPKDGPAEAIAILFTPLPGVYEVTMTAVGEGDEPTRTDAPPAKIVVDAKSPPMPPIADAALPNGVDHLDVILFVDLNNTPPEYARVLAGDGIRPLEHAWGFRYWVFDVTSPSFAASGFRRYLDGGATLASGKTLPKLAVPALLIQDRKGGVFTCEPAPTSSLAVVDKVKALHAP